MRRRGLRPIWITMSVATSILIIVLVIVINMSIQSQKQEQEGSIDYLIGVSQANLSEPWQVFVNQDIKKAASQYDNVRVIFANGGSSSEKQSSDIEKMLTLGVDLLIVSPNDERALEGTIAKVYESIPVIVLDKEIPNEQYTLFIGVDNFQLGQKAAAAVAALLPSQKGKLLEIRGSEAAYQAIERSEGFRDVIDDYPDIEIVHTIVADWMRDISEDTTKEVLAQYPNIDIVFAHNDDMAFGAYIAAQKMRIYDMKFVGIGGLEGVNGGLSLVEKGILDVTFSNTIIGGDAIDYAMQILTGSGEDIPKKIILTVNKVTDQP